MLEVAAIRQTPLRLEMPVGIKQEKDSTFCHACLNTLTQLCSPTAASRVPRLQCYKVPRFCRVPRFHSCRFPGLQGCRFREFQGSRGLDYQGSGVPSFQGSRFQASRFQTCKSPGLIYQQGNHQRNTKQTENAIELLQIFLKTQCEQYDPQ